jgi:hypothetical protein
MNELIIACSWKEIFCGVTTRGIKIMAIQLAIRNNLPHLFSMKKEKAGKKWLRNVLVRHTTMSLRKHQPTSAARIKVVMPEKLSAFFDIF